MKTVITLSKSYTVGDKTFSTIELREPTYSELFMQGLGKPFDFQPVRSGSFIRVSYPEVVDRYVQLLTVEPGYEYISRISAVDALKLESAVCDFFRNLTE